MRCTGVVSPIETPAPELSYGTCFVNLIVGADVTQIHTLTDHLNFSSRMVRDSFTATKPLQTGSSCEIRQNLTNTVEKLLKINT